jgi:hypothetical protein
LIAIYIHISIEPTVVNAQDWPVADPAGQPLEVVRQIRYDIHHRVADLLEMLPYAATQ